MKPIVIHTSLESHTCNIKLRINLSVHLLSKIYGEALSFIQKFLLCTVTQPSRLLWKSHNLSQNSTVPAQL